MRTDLQNETSRRNGSKSRGPKTETGKAISSRNRYTHGMLSKIIVIEGEEGARFSTLLNSLRADLLSRTYIEEGLVEELAICKWRQRRLLAMETACLTNEIRRQDSADTESPVTRAVAAIGNLSQDTCTLDRINRYELRFGRHFNRTLQSLLALRSAEKLKTPESNPGSC
jgi:hypothetical protein